jgi:Protein of unknown function (DUF3375)
LEHPAPGLLRSQNAAMVLGFLFHAFKAQHRATLPEGQLRALLDAYLEDLQQTAPEDYPMTSTQYLGIWCDDAHQFLRKYYGEDSTEPIFELTSGAEKAILWMEQLQGNTGFVGTESRLEGIFTGLDDILRNTTSDVNVRIEQLKTDVARIQEEIDRIRATGAAPVYTPVQVNERFATLLATARELLGDFRLVEENFKRIAQRIAEQHARPEFTKGAILGHMLDADDALKKSEQGQSFYAFWGMLLATDRRLKFQEALQNVLALPALNDRLKGNPLLKNLVSHLLIEGEKVLDSHQRMSTNLRRVLDTTRAIDRAQVQAWIKDIQSLAVRLRADPPAGEIWSVEGEPEFFNTMSRPLWQAPDAIGEINAVENSDDRISLDMLKKFSNLPHIRLIELRKNVETSLEASSTMTLEMILDRHPPKYGMTEVLGYLIVALESQKHYVGEEEDIITLPGPKPIRWRVPKVLFCK